MAFLAAAVKLSGNIEEDFRKVVFLLEENSILSETYIFEKRTFSNGNIIRTDYKKTINGYEINASFETYTQESQTFLKNAWVTTK